MNDLDPAVRRALDRIAAGKGREPTYAHPLCTCTGDKPPTVCPMHHPAKETT